ncbi:MAG TPA: alpha/beta fold hydrolase [Cyclobacteriaceae bacterium]
MNTPSQIILSRIRLCIFYSLLLVTLSHTIQAQQVVATSSWGTKFLLYTPPGYNPATPAPLLVYLHGGGSIGNDFTILTKSSASDKGPPWLIANNKWPASRPFIVISPQMHRNTLIKNKNDQEWNMDTVNEMINYVKTQFNINANKLYFTGMSFGGAGSWTYAQTYPDKVAAFVPISGKTDLTKACIVKNIPVWVFHGANDKLVFPTHSINMVNAINACSPAGKAKPNLNLLNAKEHEGWNDVWDGTDGYLVFDWLLKFTKNSTANVAPYVTAGADLRILQRSAPLSIAGEYFDTDGTITAVNWTKISGPSITLSNTNTNMLKLTNLVPGTFEFELRVTDNSGAQSFDRVIVEIVSSVAATDVSVNKLVLINGATNADIGNLTEGMVINTTSLGITQFNVRAEATATTTKSIRFRVNTDQNTRTIGTLPFLIRKVSSSTEWTMANGTYNICATPYKSSGAKGNPGVSLCYKVIVTNTPATRVETEELSSDLTGENSFDIHVYPNPARDYIHIQGDSKCQTNTNFTIVNLMGQEIQRGTLSHEELQSGTDIRFTNPRTGIHFILLRNQNLNHKIKFDVE